MDNKWQERAPSWTRLPKTKSDQLSHFMAKNDSYFNVTSSHLQYMAGLWHISEMLKLAKS